MDYSVWIAIYLPLFMLFFVILPNQKVIEDSMALRVRKRREKKVMTNEMIKQYVNNNCRISTGAYGANVKGKIISVNENWIEVETKKGKELINADYVQSIKII